MVKRILAVCCISFNDLKAIVMSIYENLVQVTDTIYCSRECTLKICNTRIPEWSFQVVCSFFDL